jgi:hypothetical protein
MELNEFLGEPSPAEVASPIEPEAPTPVAAEPEAPVERPRNEQGQFVKAEPVPEERPHTVPVSALTEERRRRQEAEARVAALTAAPEVKDDDFWTAPVETTQKIVGQQAQQVQDQLRNIRYAMAEDITASVHDDFDQVRDKFVSLHAAGDPMALSIGQQMDSQRNPARFMYEQTKKLEAVEKVGDLKTFEARIRADERARVMADAGKRPQEVPRSLNSEPSQATPDDGQSFEPTPLENLVKFNF